jgi:hypothetical protein
MRGEKWIKLDELRQPGMRRVLDALRSADERSAETNAPESFIIGRMPVEAEVSHQGRAP